MKWTIVALIILSFSTGCARYTNYKYNTHVFHLNENNELVISTFPSGYPSIKGRVPFLYKDLYAPQSVFFEFHVRATGTVAGPNPNIESILVRKLSYEFPGQNPVLLMEDYTTGFWQQGRPDHGSENSEPVPCYDGWHVLVKFDLILNGEVFKGEHILYAKEVSRVYPLISDVLR